MGESQADNLKIDGNDGIEEELRKFLNTFYEGSELGELRALLCQLGLTTFSDIQGITSTTMEKFIEEFTSSAKLVAKPGKLTLTQITAVLVKVWLHKPPNRWKRSMIDNRNLVQKQRKVEKVETTPESLGIPQIYMNELVITRSKMGQEYRERMQSIKERTKQKP